MMTGKTTDFMGFIFVMAKTTRVYLLATRRNEFAPSNIMLATIAIDCCCHCCYRNYNCINCINLYNVNDSRYFTLINVLINQKYCEPHYIFDFELLTESVYIVIRSNKFNRVRDDFGDDLRDDLRDDELQRDRDRDHDV